MTIDQRYTVPDTRLKSLTDKDSPEVDEDEEGNICEFLQWKYKWEDVIWYTLRKAIHGVERVASVRCWHDPFMMWFVQRPVNRGMVQSSMDPVDAQIRETNEQRKLKKVVESKGSIRRSVVESCMAPNFEEEEGGCENCH